MIRKARPDDIAAGVELAIRALRLERYPTLVFSRERVEATMRECISSAQHFAWVAEDDGKLVAAVGAMTVPGLFFERAECNVVMFWTEKRGYGLALLRQLFKWYRSRMVLKRINFVCEFDVDPRVEQLLQKLGMERGFPLYVHVK